MRSMHLEWHYDILVPVLTHSLQTTTILGKIETKHIHKCFQDLEREEHTG